MNNYCRDAKNYLIKKEFTDRKEIERFIDDFNDKLEHYSTNGLSCYLLCCVEICLELSGSINYKKGEAITKWLKGNSLFLGGKYDLALKCYLKSLSLLDENDDSYYKIYSKCALTQAYIGNISESLKMVQYMMDNNNSHRVNYILSTILKYRDENKLSYHLLRREKFLNDYDLFLRISSLIENNLLDKAESLLSRILKSTQEKNSFYLAYLKSFEFLIMAKKGLPIDDDILIDLLDNLSNRNSFYHFIDGQINISEIYLLIGDYNKSISLLEKILSSKKSLVALDFKIYNLLELNSVNKVDFKGAHKYTQEVSNIIKSVSTYEIDKYFRDISSFLYNEECVVS